MVLLIKALITAVLTASGATISVDGSGNGDYATIAAGVAAAVPGDTVSVADGTYNERVTVEVSGTDGNRITIKAAHRHRAVMQGFVVRGNYITINGFEITGISNDHAIKNGNLGSAGNLHVHIINNYIHDIASPDKYAILSGTHGYVAGNVLKRVQAGVHARDHSVIENNRILDLHPEKPNIHVFFLGDSITIRGNYLWDTNNSVSAAGAHFFTTWDAGNGIPSRDILMENNICFNTKHASEPSGTELGQSARFTYRNNLFVNAYYVGICTQGISDVVIYNNTFINAGTYPVWLQNCGGSHVVKNNLMAYWGDADSIDIPNGTDRSINVSGSSTTPDMDYNFVWRYVAPNNGGAHSGMFHPLTTFVNPEPFDTVLADFRLKAGATVIDAGCDMGLLYDNDGAARPAGAGYDIGAFEYQGGASAAAEPVVRAAAPGVQVPPLAADGVLHIVSDRTLGRLRITDVAGRTVWQGYAAGTAAAVGLHAAGVRPGRYFVAAGDDGVCRQFLLIQ